MPYRLMNLEEDTLRGAAPKRGRGGNRSCTLRPTSINSGKSRSVREEIGH